MARFTFKLEGVLRQRRRVERQHMRELAVRQRYLAECEAELAATNDSVRITNDALRQHHLTGVLDMSFLSAHRRFMLAMHRQVLAIAQKIAAAQKRVDEARQALSEAAKQKKIIERLREQQFERWRADLAARELREQDEIAMQLSFEAMTGGD